MTYYPFILLIWVLILSSSLRLGATSGEVYGPYNASFIPAGLGLKKPLSPDDATVQPDHSWAMYCWIKSDAPVKDSTVIAGFGEPTGEPGTQRYFVVQQANRISFWSGSSGVYTETKITPGKWQLLLANYGDDGLFIHTDGYEVSAGKLALYPAAPVIHLAPVAMSWTYAAHFSGKIAGFTLLPRVLTPQELRALLAQSKDRRRACRHTASPP